MNPSINNVAHATLAAHILTAMFLVLALAYI